MTAARKLYGDDDERMRDTLARYGESPDLADRAELWLVGTTEVLWLPDAHIAAVIQEGRPIWHRQVEPKDAARCPYPDADPGREGSLCDGHWEERQSQNRRPADGE